MEQVSDLHEPLLEDVTHLKKLSLELESPDCPITTVDLQVLERLAVSLRNVEHRIPLGRTTLPQSIVVILERCSQRDPRVTSTVECIQQSGRVAANLIAECDVNRGKLVHSGLISPILAILSARDHVDTIVHCQTVRPLIATLLNLVVEGHDQSTKCLASWTSLNVVLETSERLLEWASQQLLEYDDIEGMVHWLWAITLKVVQKVPVPLAETLDATSLSHLARLSQCLVPTAERSAPLVQVTDVATSCEVIETLCEQEAIHVEAFSDVTGEGSQMDRLTAFVVNGDLPLRGSSVVEGEDDEEEEQEDPSKTFSRAKESLVRAFVELSANSGFTRPKFNGFWDAVHQWLDRDDRSDLLMCALLCFGNSSRTDTAATALLSGPQSLLSRLVGLLKPQTPITVQHALVGLLRNLSIPEANKAILGDAGVIGKLLDMEPWNTNMDMVGSVQGGAVSLIKNLCRDNISNSQRFLDDQHGLKPLLALMSRTDDKAIGFESSRIFVNIIKSICKDGKRHPDLFEKIGSREVVAYLCDMIRTGTEMPVLVNEGVIALTLLVTFGPSDLVGIVIDELAREKQLTEGQKGNAVAALVELLKAHKDEPVYTGIYQNSRVLAGQLLDRTTARSGGVEEIRQISLITSESAGDDRAV